MSRKPSKKISGTDLPAATTQKAQSSPPARVAHIGIAVRDLDEALHAETDRRLAATGFTHQPERLAGADTEADPHRQ